jgi:tetratricopeptide (TPR) repeat protein
VAQLQGANLVDANLEDADLRSAKCGGAHFVGANLVGADLTGADLRGATLKFANLRAAKVDGAKVEDADLTGVKLTPEQKAAFHRFDQAIIRQKLASESEKKRLATEEAHDDLFREEDCYKILDVLPDASLEAIGKAYRQRIKEYHPDKVNLLGEKLKIVARREFERIQHAYRSLTRHRSKPAAQMGTSPGLDPQLSKKLSSEFTIEDYQRILEADPENESAYYNLGIRYFEKGLINLAIEAYKKALALNPRNADAQHNLKLAELARSLER